MSKRKASRDLMADLLSERQPPAAEPVTGRVSAERSRPPLRPEPKIKMTLSLPGTVADRLTRFETDMRLHTGERGHALAKSAIIAMALELLLDEYDQDGMESRLARYMDPRRRGRV